MRSKFLLAAAAVTLALATGAASTQAWAADVKIGAVFPLSGNAANAGRSSLAAIQLAVDIINNKHPELSALPSVGPGGLANLGGAKIVLVSADHQGNPAEGQSQTLRLITQEKVAALIGAYQSNVSFTATAVA